MARKQRRDPNVGESALAPVVDSSSGGGSETATRIEPGRLPVFTNRPSAAPSAAQLHEPVTGTTNRAGTTTVSSPIGAKPLFTRKARTESALALPPFDEARAVDAGLLSHGGVWAARLARLEAAVPPRAVPEALIGPDDRVQVTTTTDYPYRCVCYLRIWLNGGWMAYGTGWIIGKRTVITAGHCVYAYPDADAPDLVRGWAQQVEVIPGRNADGMPFGSFIVPTGNLRSTRGWTGTNGTGDDGKQEGADYGAIILNDDLPADFGEFGFGVLQDNELQGLSVNIIGYPGEYRTPPLLGTMWGDSGPLAAPSALQLEYTIDTTAGESGAAVFYIRPTKGDAIAVGIHNYGTQDMSNNATRITEGVTTNLKAWRAEGVGGGTEVATQGSAGTDDRGAKTPVLERSAAKVDKKSSIEPGRIGRAAGSPEGLHKSVSGAANRGSKSGAQGKGPAEELPPFDESRAVAAEVLAYGDPARKTEGGQESAIEPGRLGSAADA